MFHDVEAFNHQHHRKGTAYARSLNRKLGLRFLLHLFISHMCADTTACIYTSYIIYTRFKTHKSACVISTSSLLCVLVTTHIPPPTLNYFLSCGYS